MKEKTKEMSWFQAVTLVGVGVGWIIATQVLDGTGTALLMFAIAVVLFATIRHLPQTKWMVGTSVLTGFAVWVSWLTFPATVLGIIGMVVCIRWFCTRDE